jgi:hypothetical protein
MLIFTAFETSDFINIYWMCDKYCIYCVFQYNKKIKTIFHFLLTMWHVSILFNHHQESNISWRSQCPFIVIVKIQISNDDGI